MRVPSNAASIEGLVPFHDCDPLGIVWHGNYSKYLALARQELLSRHQLGVADFIALDLKLFVIESRIRYAFPLKFGERYQVRAWIKDYEQRIHVAYQVDNLTHGRRAARAWTTLVTANPAGEMLWETPKIVMERLANAPGVSPA